MARGVKRTHCRKCERHIDDVGRLSARGLCVNCGVMASIANAEQLHHREGDYHERWKAAMRRSVAKL